VRNWETIRKIPDERGAPFRLHVLDFDSRDADLSTCAFRILDGRVFLLILFHLLMHYFRCFSDDIVEEDGSTLPSTHPQNKTITDVLQTVGPWIPEEFDDFDELSKMKILLGGDYVDHFVGFVRVVSLNSPANITRKI
jgi:hypothetical protein